MVLERVIFTAKEGSEADFQAAFANARRYLEESVGCQSVELLQGVERPETFLLLVEWDLIESHMEGFVKSPSFAAFAELLGPHLNGGPQMEHYASLYITSVA